jgi:hypothetical protein
MTLDEIMLVFNELPDNLKLYIERLILLHKNGFTGELIARMAGGNIARAFENKEIIMTNKRQRV